MYFASALLLLFAFFRAKLSSFLAADALALISMARASFLWAVLAILCVDPGKTSAHVPVLG
jgi:hypothetical protein